MNSDVEANALIEEHVRRLLLTMGIEPASIACQAVEGDVLRINIQAGENGRLLIGTHGTHLGALEHIVRCLLRPHMTTPLRIIVDVNEYRIRRDRVLLRLAEEVARRAHRTGRTVVLRPMKASDRRTIHTALASHQDIQTESQGDEPNRRVVVRPVFL